MAFHFIHKWYLCVSLFQSGEIDVVNHKTGDRCHLKFAPYSYFSRDVARKVSQQPFHWLLSPRMQTCHFFPLSSDTLCSFSCSVCPFCNLCLLSLPPCATPLSRSRGWWRIKMGKHTMFCLGRGTRRWSALVWCRAAEGERTAPTGDRKPSIRRSKPKSCGGRLRCRKIFPDAYNISQV